MYHKQVTTLANQSFPSIGGTWKHTNLRSWGCDVGPVGPVGCVGYKDPVGPVVCVGYKDPVGHDDNVGHKGHEPLGQL